MYHFETYLKATKAREIFNKIFQHVHNKDCYLTNEYGGWSLVIVNPKI